jgi:hypothetical protein
MRLLRIAWAMDLLRNEGCMIVEGAAKVAVIVPVRYATELREENDIMADEKHINAVRFFCMRPFSDSGSKRSKGPNHHDWSDLVQQISYFDFGHIQKDAAIVQTVDRLVRKEFPNGSEWDKHVNATGAQERILSIIRNGLANAGAA